MKLFYNFLLAVLCLFFLSGCISGQHELRVNPDYFSENSISVGSKLIQSGIIYTTKEDDGFVYQSGADSSIGRSAQFDIPVGAMTKAIASTVMSVKFKKGCKNTNSFTTAAQHSIIMHPRIASYVHKFRMGLIGINVVPQIDLVLQFDLLNPAKKVIYSKKYKSGLRSGETFLSNAQATEAINKLTHETILNMMKRAARELEDILNEVK